MTDRRQRFVTIKDIGLRDNPIDQMRLALAEQFRMIELHLEHSEYAVSGQMATVSGWNEMFGGKPPRRGTGIEVHFKPLRLGIAVGEWGNDIALGTTQISTSPFNCNPRVAVPDMDGNRGGHDE